MLYFVKSAYLEKWSLVVRHYKGKKYCVKALVFTGFLLVLPALAVSAENVDTVMKQVVANLNGKTAVMKIIMAVKTSRAERVMEMKSYSIGQEKSFIKILYPKKDEGITFLKVNNSMWQYVPRIEKIIKIPASMMLQSWMGSDFSNDDLVKESSLYEDYTHKLISETEFEYNVELHPKVDAAVVWGKIHMSVSKEYFLPKNVSYFDEDGVLIRELVYTEVKPFGDRFYPSLWIMTPKTADKEGHETRITVSDAVFDGDVDEEYFSKRALKRFSR
jgi:outer membrane lipoprotein-sorting protein